MLRGEATEVHHVVVERKKEESEMEDDMDSKKKF
jgi:hypothetical protein